MKKSLLLLGLAISVPCFLIQAQTDPGTTNLKHQWTFDNGTANDVIGSVNGTLMGGAVIDASTKALKTSADGDYLSLSGTDLALNSYSELTLEAWITSTNTNTGNPMLCYFGNTTNDLGAQGVFITTISRSAISCSNISAPWSSEDNVGGINCNNSALHHVVSVVTASEIRFYVDGNFQGSKALSTGNSISALGTGVAYLAKSGYSVDQTWQGLIYEFSIYNKALSSDEINYLYLKGDGATPYIQSSVSSIETSSSASFKVWSGNLSETITITAPAGITVKPSILQSNSAIVPVNVSVTYDGITAVDGNITLTSGTTTANISIKAASTGFSCFNPLYADTITSNILADPYCSSYFSDGWGSKSINTDPTYIYCGNGSGKIDGGSYDRALTGKLKPNTKYRVKAKVWQVSGSTVGIGVYGWNGTATDIYHGATTSDAWEDIDFTFTTGTILNSGGHGLFFNSGTGYIDNWEMYEMPCMQFSASSLTYLTSGTQKVAVKGIHLSNDISITAPVNFTVAPSKLAVNVNGDSVSITYDGLASSTGYVYFISGTSKDSIQVSGIADPIIVPSISFLTFDELNKEATFTVIAGNLNDSIRFTVPSGYSINPKALAANANGTTVTVTFDGTTEIKDYIILTSETAQAKVRVIGTLNSTTYTPLYSAGNLITDPYFNSLNTYGGWGDDNKGITTDTNEVYSGSKSFKMKGACGASLDYSLTGKMLSNKTYRLKAMVKTTGNYKFIVNGCDVDGSNDYYIDVNTSENWQIIDTTFTTGTLAANQNLYFNSCEGYDGTLAYIDNYELYVAPAISVDPLSLTFSGEETKTFTATGLNLSQSVSITAPTGFSVNPSTLDATASAAVVSVTYNGINNSDGYIYLTSGSVKDSVQVSGTVVTEIGAVSNELSQFVYTNNGLINVSLDLANDTEVELSVFTADSRLLLKQKGNYFAGKNHVVLDVNLSSGIYIVNIVREGKSFNYKVINM